MALPSERGDFSWTRIYATLSEWLRFQLAHDSITRVTESRKMLEQILSENKVAYGINTGIGKFARVVIPEDKLG